MPEFHDLAIDSLDRSEMLRYLGYRGQAYDPSLDAGIDEAVARAVAVSRPRCAVATFEVAGRGEADDGTPEVRLAGTALVLRGRAIFRHLEGAQAVGVLAVTLGMSNERELKHLSLTDHMAHILLDAASTTLVERAADASESYLVAEAADRRLYTNFRFSPGYGDLPMDTQPVLLRTLDATRRLGITLTPTLLMTPTKSVTAVAGMFPTRQRSTHGNCERCALADFCTIRPTGRTCHDSFDE